MRRNRLTTAFLAPLALVHAAGCGEPHVALEAARPGASLAERQKSYDHLRPAATSHTVVVNASDGSVSAAAHSSVILANGQTVHHPEDMIPVVGADSPTAEAARRHAHHDRWDSVGWTLSTIGVLVALGSIAIPVVDELDERNPSPDIWWTGVIGGAAALVVGSGVSYYHGTRARDAKVAAFATYDASLRENLDLCVEGTRLVDCQASTSAPAPDCSAAGTFQLALRYTQGCTGPAHLTIAHHPGVARELDLTPGTSDPRAEALDTVAFTPRGCHAELVYRGPAGELRLTWDGAANDRIEGHGTLTSAGRPSCPLEVRGSFAEP